MTSSTPALEEAADVAGASAEVATPARPDVSYIPSLDGIRAISFLTVFLAHAGLGSFIPGYFGLNLFFFLSGFLITTLMRVEYDRHQDISFKNFYLRRALRILPPFYLVLAVAYAFTALGLMGGSLSLGAVLAQVFHVTNYYIVRHGWWEGLAPGTWVYWSLAVEEHFYLFFPLLYLWLRKRRDSAGQAIVLLGICAVVLAWRCVLIFGFDAPKDRTYVASDTRVDSILAGCILAIWKNPVFEKPDEVADRRLLRVWLPLGALAVLISLVVRKHHFDQTFRYTLQSFGLMPFFMAAMRFHDRLPFSLLNWGPAKRLGVFSYSMYLMHTSLLWGLEHAFGWSPLACLVPALVLLVVLASLIHRYVETPFARVRRRLVR